MQGAHDVYVGGICEASENLFNEKILHHKKEKLSEDVINWMLGKMKIYYWRIGDITKCW